MKIIKKALYIFNIVLFITALSLVLAVFLNMMTSVHPFLLVGMYIFSMILILGSFASTDHYKVPKPLVIIPYFIIWLFVFTDLIWLLDNEFRDIADHFLLVNVIPIAFMLLISVFRE